MTLLLLVLQAFLDHHHKMQGSGGDSKETGNSTGVPATSPIMHGTSDNNGEISLVGSE